MPEKDMIKAYDNALAMMTSEARGTFLTSDQYTLVLSRLAAMRPEDVEQYKGNENYRRFKKTEALIKVLNNVNPDDPKAVVDAILKIQPKSALTPDAKAVSEGRPVQGRPVSPLPYEVVDDGPAPKPQPPAQPNNRVDNAPRPGGRPAFGGGLIPAQVVEDPPGPGVRPIPPLPPEPGQAPRPAPVPAQPVPVGPLIPAEVVEPPRPRPPEKVPNVRGGGPNYEQLKEVLWDKIFVAEDEIPRTLRGEERREFIDGVKKRFLEVMIKDSRPEVTEYIMNRALVGKYEAHISLKSTVDALYTKVTGYQREGHAAGLATETRTFNALGMVDDNGKWRNFGGVQQYNPDFDRQVVHETGHVPDIVTGYRFSGNELFKQARTFDRLHANIMQDFHTVLSQRDASVRVPLTPREKAQLEAMYFERRKAFNRRKEADPTATFQVIDHDNPLPRTLDEYLKQLEEKKPAVRALMEEGRSSGAVQSTLKDGAPDRINQYIEALRDQYKRFGGVSTNGFVNRFGLDVNENVRTRITELDYYSRDKRVTESFAKVIDAERVNLNPEGKPLPDGRNPLATLLVPNLEDHLHTVAYPAVDDENTRMQRDPRVMEFHTKNMERSLKTIQERLGNRGNRVGNLEGVVLRVKAGNVSEGDTVIRIKIVPGMKDTAAKLTSNPDVLKGFVQGTNFEGATAHIVVNAGSNDQYIEIRKQGITAAGPLEEATKRVGIPIKGVDELRAKALLSQAFSQSRVYTSQDVTPGDIITRVNIAGSPTELEVLRERLNRAQINATYTDDTRTVLALDPDQQGKFQKLLPVNTVDALPIEADATKIRTRALMESLIYEGRVFSQAGQKPGKNDEIIYVRRVGILVEPEEANRYVEAFKAVGINAVYDPKDGGVFVRSAQTDQVCDALPENWKYENLPKDEDAKSRRYSAVIYNSYNEGKMYRSDVAVRDATGAKTGNKRYVHLIVDSPEDAEVKRKILAKQGITAQYDATRGERGELLIHEEASLNRLRGLIHSTTGLPDSREAAQQLRENRQANQAGGMYDEAARNPHASQADFDKAAGRGLNPAALAELDPNTHAMLKHQEVVARTGVTRSADMTLPKAATRMLDAMGFNTEEGYRAALETGRVEISLDPKHPDYAKNKQKVADLLEARERMIQQAEETGKRMSIPVIEMEGDKAVIKLSDAASQEEGKPPTPQENQVARAQQVAELMRSAPDYKASVPAQTVVQGLLSAHAEYKQKISFYDAVSRLADSGKLDGDPLKMIDDEVRKLNEASKQVVDEAKAKLEASKKELEKTTDPDEKKKRAQQVNDDAEVVKFLENEVKRQNEVLATNREYLEAAKTYQDAQVKLQDEKTPADQHAALKQQAEAATRQMDSIRQATNEAHARVNADALHNKTMNEHIRNTRGSLLLNANQTVQGIMNINKVWNDPELDKPGHELEKIIKRSIAVAHIGMGGVGAVVDAATMYKPSSRLGLKFGGVTSVVGAGISAYELFENINKPYTGWDKEGRAILSSSLNLGISTVGAVGSGMAWLGGESAAMIGGRLITISAASGGALAVVTGAAMLTEAYADHAVARSEIYHKYYAEGKKNAGGPGTFEAYCDIPGLKPLGYDYMHVMSVISAMEKKNLTYDDGTPIKWKEILEKNPKEFARLARLYAQSNTNYAEEIRKEHFDGFLTAEDITTSKLGTGLANAFDAVGIRNARTRVDEHRAEMDAAYLMAARLNAAADEVAGHIGPGVRNYNDRLADYRRIIQPLEKDYADQVKELEKLRAARISVDKKRVEGREIDTLDIQNDSPEMKRITAARDKAYNEQDEPRYKRAEELSKLRSLPEIQKFLGVSDAEWKKKGADGKSLEDIVTDLSKRVRVELSVEGMKSKVDELMQNPLNKWMKEYEAFKDKFDPAEQIKKFQDLMKSGGLPPGIKMVSVPDTEPLMKFLHQHVQSTSASRVAVAEEIAKINFEREAKKVEPLLAKERVVLKKAQDATESSRATSKALEAWVKGKDGPDAAKLLEAVKAAEASALKKYDEMQEAIFAEDKRYPDEAHAAAVKARSREHFILAQQRDRANAASGRVTHDAADTARLDYSIGYESDATKYFQKNAEFLKKAGLEGRRDLGLVGLTSSREQYFHKKIQYAPAMLVPQAQEEKKLYEAALEKTKKSIEILAKHAASVDGVMKTLGLPPVGDAPVLNGTTPMLDENKKPMTSADVIANLDKSLERERAALAKLKTEAQTDKGAELAARIALSEATLARLEKDKAATQESNLLYKVQQMEKALQVYARENGERFIAANEATRFTTPLLTAEQKKEIDTLTRKALEAKQKLTDLQMRGNGAPNVADASIRPVPPMRPDPQDKKLPGSANNSPAGPDELLKAEAAYLVAQRALADRVYAMAKPDMVAQKQKIHDTWKKLEQFRQKQSEILTISSELLPHSQEMKEAMWKRDDALSQLNTNPNNETARLKLTAAESAVIVQSNLMAEAQFKELVSLNGKYSLKTDELRQSIRQFEEQYAASGGGQVADSPETVAARTALSDALMSPDVLPEPGPNASLDERMAYETQRMQIMKLERDYLVAKSEDQSKARAEVKYEAVRQPVAADARVEMDVPVRSWDKPNSEGKYEYTLEDLNKGWKQLQRNKDHLDLSLRLGGAFDPAVRQEPLTKDEFAAVKTRSENYNKAAQAFNNTPTPENQKLLLKASAELLKVELAVTHARQERHDFKRDRGRAEEFKQQLQHWQKELGSIKDPQKLMEKLIEIMKEEKKLENTTSEKPELEILGRIGGNVEDLKKHPGVKEEYEKLLEMIGGQKILIKAMERSGVVVSEMQRREVGQTYETRDNAVALVKEKVGAYAKLLEEKGMLKKGSADKYTERVMKKLENLDTEALGEAATYVDAKIIRTKDLMEATARAADALAKAEVGGNAEVKDKAQQDWDKALAALQKEMKNIDLKGVNGGAEVDVSDMMNAPAARGTTTKPAPGKAM